MARPRKVTPEAISLASLLLARRLDVSAVYRVLETQHELSARSAQRVLAAARAELLAKSGRSAEEHRQDAYAFYDSVARDPATGMALRLRAQDKICDLLGLMAPIRATMDIPGGVPIRGAVGGAVVFLPAEEPLREAPAPGEEGGEGEKTPPQGGGEKTPPGGPTKGADGTAERDSSAARAAE